MIDRRQRGTAAQGRSGRASLWCYDPSWSTHHLRTSQPPACTSLRPRRTSPYIYLSSFPCSKLPPVHSSQHILTHATYWSGTCVSDQEPDFFPPLITEITMLCSLCHQCHGNGCEIMVAGDDDQPVAVVACRQYKLSCHCVISYTANLEYSVERRYHRRGAGARNSLLEHHV